MQQIQDMVKAKMPMQEDELMFEFKQAKKYALEEFRKRAMGDDFS